LIKFFVSLPVLAGALALTSAPVSAQELASADRPTAEKFITENGGDWIVAPRAVTGDPGMIYGKRLTLPTAPRTTAAFEAAARQVVDTYPELFGFDSNELRHSKTKSLELSRIGSSDKVAVKFDQVVDGIQVFNGHVTILFDAKSGDVLALDSTGQPNAEQAASIAVTSVNQALAIAEAAYAEKFGFAAASIDSTDAQIIGPEPFWGLKSPLQDRGPVLAWIFEMSTPGLFKDGLPAQVRIYVSAEGDGEVFKVQPTAYHIDGQVKGNVNTGQEPNTTTNQENPSLVNMYVRANTANGNILATTGADGLYNTGTTGPTTLFFELQGPYCNVINEGGANASVVIANATGSNNDAQFNPTKAEFPTAEVAGFYWVNVMREYIVSVDPSDNTMDFSVQTEVNKNDLLCNAYFDGNSINLERNGSGCLNTCYSDVVVHEEGHYANAVYQGGGITGAFHEGNADNYAYYINDDPCLSHFNGGGGCLRTALQTTRFKCSPDGNESCNGGASHTEGQVIASAIWRVRDNLNQTYGNAIGDNVADALFSGWMNAYNDKSIVNIIRDHWLVLDDDDGNLGNGTPNQGDIQEGFQFYGWPAPPDLAINVTSAPASNGQVGHGASATVIATITSQQGTVTSANVDYSVSGAPTASVAMAPTGNPDEFSGQIPGVASPNSVEWSVSAGSSAGNNLSSASDVYHVGVVTILQSFGFDGGTDNGWTHVSLGGQSGDQWARGNPSGSNESSDPNAAYSPANVWGTDLSLNGFDGKYEPNGSGELRSPTFNLSGTTSVRLQYRRWLAVEEAQYDQATIFVNGQNVWQNAFSGHHIDAQWELQDIDISSIAAGNPSVQIAYRLTSDGGLEFGGWNIDDFTLYTIDASAVGSFANYGTGCGASSVPTIAGSGQVAINRTVNIDVANGQPNAAGLLLIGASQASVSIGGGCTSLVGGVIGSGFSVPLDGNGAVQLSGTIPSNAPAASSTYFQFFSADGASATGYAATDGLKMTLP